jgi:SAM-dependent methyltransferase
VNASRTAPRLGTLDLVEGLQLGHALSTLHDLGVLAALRTPRTAAELAAQFRLDPALLAAALEWLVARTELLRKRGGRFRTTAAYTAADRYLIDLYAGAFGANAMALPELLRHPARAGARVDRRRHAHAFLHVSGGDDSMAAELLLGLGCRGVLDLGCGPATLLRVMARHDGELRGWGIEANPAMCRLARTRLREAGVAPRVRILRGDGRDPAAVLPARARPAVDTLVAGDLANELCAGDGRAAGAWLRRLRRDFPGRLLLVSDYYGRLGHRGAARRETLLHDYVQAISGQGIPPPDRRAWQTLYRAAGVRLLHCIEDTATTRFLHLLRL